MRYTTLGKTGLEVSQICLGAMAFGPRGNPDHDESIRIVHRALDAGCNFIDTADVYSHGESEEILSRALAGGRRDRIVLATKGHHRMGDGPNQGGNSRRWLLEAVDNSLRRLRTDWIDLYQIHRPDPSCDIDETLGVLTDLIRAGKLRYIGTSTFPAHEIVEAQWVAERRGRERFICEQPPYSILARGIEADVLPVCERYGMGVIAWAPLASGWLSGAYRQGRELPPSVRKKVIPHRFDISMPENQRKLEAAERLALLAEQAGLSMVQLAIGFVLAHRALTAAIVGPRKPEHLEGYLTAADVYLDDAVLDEIDAIVPPGTNLNPGDAGFEAPALLDPALRRRAY